MLPVFYRLTLLPLSFFMMACCQGLYSADDHCFQIKSSKEFNDLVYQKHKAFFIQFYSSKDGNSGTFAPIWKKLARDIDSWSDIVKIAAVDCELDSNANICKEQNLNGYPTLKYFKYETAGPQDGQIYEGKKNSVDDLSSAIARFVLADFEKQKQSDWPNFALAHDNKPGENLWREGAHYLALVFEQYPSGNPSWDQMPVVGAQTILDFSKDKDVMVRRGTSRHQLGRANDIGDFPGLLMFSRSHEGSPVHKSRDSLTREEISAKMNRYMDVTSKEHGHQKPARDDL